MYTTNQYDTNCVIALLLLELRGVLRLPSEFDSTQKLRLCEDDKQDQTQDALLISARSPSIPIPFSSHNLTKQPASKQESKQLSQQ